MSVTNVDNFLSLPKIRWKCTVTHKDLKLKRKRKDNMRDDN